MSSNLARLCGALVCAVVLTTASSAVAEPPDQRLLNGGAESEPTGVGWTMFGFEVASYGDPGSPPGNPAYGDVGRRFFAARRDGATLSQTVDVSDLSESIDANAQPLALGGLLGASGTTADGVRLMLLFLDAAGNQLGQPVGTGTPTARDRGTAGAASCFVGVQAIPVGTRSVRMSAVATGSTGFADALFVTTMAVGASADTQRGDAVGCYRLKTPAAPSLPASQGAPAPTTMRKLVSLPARRIACSRSLRFTISASVVASVKSFSVRMLGKTHTIRPTASKRSIVLRAQRQKRRALVRVLLKDGRTATSRRTFSACARG